MGVSQFLSEFISDYKTCWLEWNELHGYTGEQQSAVEGVNDDLRMAYEALSETLTLGSNGTSTLSATFGSEERAKYEEECNKIEGTVFWDYPDTTLTCENDEGSTSATVALWADCYPDSEACKDLDEKGDAINEGILKVMWQMGNKCTFDGGTGWDLGEEVISSGENPYDPSYQEDNMSTGDDEALVNAEDENLVDEVMDAVSGEDENVVDTVKDAIDSDEAKNVLGDGTVSKFLSEFISDYKTCWLEWNELHGYTGEQQSAVEGVNDDLRMAYEALSETLTLGSNGTSTLSATFGSEERAKYEEECNKIEGTVFLDYPDTTLTCENDEGSTSATVALWADCYPDSEACKDLDEKGDAINEGILKVMWQMGNKCTFDGTDGWDLDEEVISSGENPYDPSYKDDVTLPSSGDDELSTGATPMKTLGLAVTAVLGLMMIS